MFAFCMVVLSTTPGYKKTTTQKANTKPWHGAPLAVDEENLQM
jgi:hypothetical protein